MKTFTATKLHTVDLRKVRLMSRNSHIHMYHLLHLAIEEYASRHPELLQEASEIGAESSNRTTEKSRIDSVLDTFQKSREGL